MGWKHFGMIFSSIEAIYNKLDTTRKQKVCRYAGIIRKSKKEIHLIISIAFTQQIQLLQNYDYQLVEAFNDKGCIEIVEVGSASSQYDLAFQVCGGSMHPTFQDGEIVFVKETMDIYNGQIGAIEING